jgi:hypothetical protein
LLHNAGSSGGRDALPASTEPHLFNVFRTKAPQAVDLLNEARNWLKHDKPPDRIDLYEFEVFVALARAVTKYYSVYGEETREMGAFHQWAFDRGYLSRRPQRQ